MEKPVYVTKVGKKQPIKYVSTTVFGRDWTFDDITWWTQNYNIASFDVPGFSSEGFRLVSKIRECVPARNKKKIDELLKELEKHRLKTDDEKQDFEIWNERAGQKPGDWGPVGVQKQKLKEIVMEKARGRVLEAMCGFNSYFIDSETIESVVAMDFSRTGLELYSNPERTRILFDFSTIKNGNKIGFFEDSSFETIGVFFAMDYLDNVAEVYREFKRILSNNGQVFVVGGTAQGYQDLLKRQFNPDFHKNRMTEAGLEVHVQKLPLKVEAETGEYFLVRGIKND